MIPVFCCVCVELLDRCTLPPKLTLNFWCTLPPKLTLNFWCTVPPKLTLGELKLLVYIKGGSRILESRVSPSVRNHALLGGLGIDCIALKSYIIYGLGACPPENF